MKPIHLDSLIVQSIIGLDPAPADAPLDSAAGQAATIWAAARASLEDFAATTARIATDDALSDKGRTERIVVEAERISKRIAEHRARVPQFKAKMSKIAESVRLLPPANPTLHHLQLMEIRQHLEKLNPLLRDNALRDAAHRGDAMTLEAARTAPAIAPLTTEAVMVEVDTAYLQHVAPDKAEQLETLDQVIHASETALDSVSSFITENLPAGARPDPIKDMAEAAE